MYSALKFIRRTGPWHKVLTLNTYSGLLFQPQRTQFALEQQGRLLSSQATPFHDPASDNPHFPGTSAAYTETLKLLFPSDSNLVPVYHLMRRDGGVYSAEDEPQLSPVELLKWYRCMMLLDTMDHTVELFNRGNISFYITNHGEQGIQIGSAAALDSRDLIFGQYREAGVLMYRGFGVDQCLAQCFGTSEDPAHGRQMPVHYGSSELNFVTISTPLATQMPQAAGAAYAYKREQNGLAVVCYFGEGAASEGDFHAAFNFAATLDCPVIFICRNNGFAISTPTSDQYRGDGVASRAPGYGMATVRVDGNDILAVYNATRAARDYAITEMKPVLIEAMTYRLGDHHLTDESSRYRSKKEVDYFKSHEHPIKRLRNYLTKRGIWDSDLEAALVQECERHVLECFKHAKAQKKPSPTHLFTDVYDQMPSHIQRQHQELKNHVQKYPADFPVDLHEQFARPY